MRISRTHIKYGLIALLGLFFVFVVADTLGIFNPEPWYEVPHGNHTHYLPKDCDPPLSTSQAPTTRPEPGQTVDCTGAIVSIVP